MSEELCELCSKPLRGVLVLVGFQTWSASRLKRAVRKTCMVLNCYQCMTVLFETPRKSMSVISLRSSHQLRQPWVKTKEALVFGGKQPYCSKCDIFFESLFGCPPWPTSSLLLFGLCDFCCFFSGADELTTLECSHVCHEVCTRVAWHEVEEKPAWFQGVLMCLGSFLWSHPLRFVFFPILFALLMALKRGISGFQTFLQEMRHFIGQNINRCACASLLLS